VLWYGGTMVIDGKLTTGKLSSFVMYAITLSVGILGATGVLNLIITAVGVAEKAILNYNI